jgi:hypothetical protein
MTIAERFERHWSKAWGWALVAVGVLGALAVFAARPTFPNYDTYYTLVWGQELFHGGLPDYHTFRPPTPHPLATFVGWLAAPFGTDSDRLLVLASMLLFVGLLVIVFRFTQRLLGSLVALVAVLAVLTRTDVELLALRAMADLPFYVLVFGAAAYELRRPRSGWPVLVLLALAGLLRPEAWLLAGVYWLYLIPVSSRRQLVWYAVLVAAAPLIWLAADTLVEHAPLYSLTETRDVAGQFGRNRSVFEAIKLIPDHLGATDKVINFGVGGLGFLLALALLRERALIPLALGALGLITFLLIVAAGLSAIPRYLTVPSLLLTMCVAVALTGWTVARERWLKIAAIVVAVISVAAIVKQLPQLNKDRATIMRQATFVSEQHRDLFAVLDDPRVVPLWQDRRCWPITTPTHSAIPVVRYETGLPKRALQASIQQHNPPKYGLLLIGKTFQFEPGSGRRSLGTKSSASAKWWSNVKLGSYRPVAKQGRWSVWARCRPSGTDTQTPAS